MQPPSAKKTDDPETKESEPVPEHLENTTEEAPDPFSESSAEDTSQEQDHPMPAKKLESSVLRRTARLPSITDLNTEEGNMEPDDGSDETGSEDSNKSRNESFNHEDLEQAWKSFASIRRKQGKAQEQHIFTQPYTILDDGVTIVIELNNSLQTDILEEIKSDFVQYLRNKLSNDSIMIGTKLTKDNGKKKLYTSKEKLDYLAQKNPIVGELQKKLGLDPEF